VFFAKQEGSLMFNSVLTDLPALIAAYGYGLILVMVMLESLGLPLPGETTLITASIYAGATHDLSLLGIIAAAAAGAVIGDNIGFRIGENFGSRLLIRFGPRLGITPAKIKLGQYLFMRHGGKVVFFGRFVAVLRALAAFLAGANKMPWPRFFVLNVAGGIVWATLYGCAAYGLGARVHALAGPVGFASLLLAAAFMVWLFLLMRRHEARLEQEAERAIPGPIAPH
jgi:membrane protein DedA with SNARE-associated domain